MPRLTLAARAVFVFAAGFALVAVSPSSAIRAVQKIEPPRRILIIRHAEKPPPEDNSPNLNAVGKQRAEALYQLFTASKQRPNPFPSPDFLFAAQNSKTTFRSAQTVAPLAEKLKLPVDSRFTKDDCAMLAREILTNPKYSGKTILIAWRHGTLPALAKELGASAPETWKDAVFDRVWEITYDASGKASFQDRPQRLLPGDSKK